MQFEAEHRCPPNLELHEKECFNFLKLTATTMDGEKQNRAVFDRNGSHTITFTHE